MQLQKKNEIYTHFMQLRKYQIFGASSKFGNYAKHYPPVIVANISVTKL